MLIVEAMRCRTQARSSRIQRGWANTSGCRQCQIPVPGAGTVKTSAAWLIEKAGFRKGYAIGPAGVSSKHTLALVNRGGARAADIVRLAREMRRGVEDKFGIRLVPEPVFVGFREAF
jgi:UDP-N-acetylenolpyruvoylglucosamine reductase